MSYTGRFARHFSRVLMERGKHYHRDGRVQVRSVDPDGVEAVVECSSPLVVRISLDEASFRGGCECSYSAHKRPCKHAWAVLMCLDSDPGSSPAKALSEQGAPPQAKPERRGSPRDSGASGALPSELRYVLDLDRSRSRGSGLVVIQGRRGERWTNLRVSKGDVARFADAEDRRILGAVFGLDLDGDPLGSTRPTTVIECSAFTLGDVGEVPLADALCSTGRFWVAAQGRRSRRVKYQPEPDGVLGLDFGASDSDEANLVQGFIRCEDQRKDFRDLDLILEEVYLEGDTFRPYTHGDEFEWVEKLRPEGEKEVAETTLTDLFVRLTESGSAVETILPEAWSTAEVEDAPSLLLQIRGTGLEGDDRDSVQAVLEFEYGPRRIPWGHPGVAIVDRDGKVIYPRNVDREQAAMDRLEGAGGIPLATTVGDGPRGMVRFGSRKLSQEITTLQSEDWQIQLEDRAYRGHASVRVSVSSGIDWFDVDAEVEFEGMQVSIGDILAGARSNSNIVELPDGSRGFVPEDWLRRVRMLQSVGEDKGDGIRLKRSQAWIIDALQSDIGTIDYDESFQRYREELSNLRNAPTLTEASEFDGTLREYQRDALGWFQVLEHAGLGGCLADDMGLGKTVQVLAWLQLRERTPDSPPSVVIAPRSVVYNWVQEAKRFVPELRAREYTGPDRKEMLDEWDDLDLIVTSYGVLRRDFEDLSKKSIDYLVLDEAQAIKNARSLTARCARGLQAHQRLALSGTPIENHLSELWSLFEFLNPGMLGPSRRFRQWVSGRSDRVQDRQALATALAPFLLRRTKQQVASELPERTEQVLYCDMDELQRGHYDELARFYRESVFQEVNERGITGARMHILEGLLRLRQVACHPALLDPSTASPSCKLDLLVPQLQEIIEEGHKALVFSQFTTFLSHVKQRLDAENITYEYLDGSTRNRRDRVQRFQEDPSVPVFLISLKAGGLGLNLTAADYVYILDPWWNPAVESQAIDRSHRIGQTRHVFAYRMICRNTVEEKILQLQDRKRDLAESIIRSDQPTLQDLGAEELELLFS